MAEAKPFRPGRGGRRKGAGRKPSGRTQIKIRIKTEIIEQLQPGAARKLTEFIEKRFNIIVWRLDRWGRSLSDLTQSLEDLRTVGVDFVSITEALDLTTPTGRAMAGMLAIFTEFERAVLRERVL